jgi:hypothetical protein
MDKEKCKDCHGDNFKQGDDNSNFCPDPACRGAGIRASH